MGAAAMAGMSDSRLIEIVSRKAFVANSAVIRGTGLLVGELLWATSRSTGVDLELSSSALEELGVGLQLTVHPTMIDDVLKRLEREQTPSLSGLCRFFGLVLPRSLRVGATVLERQAHVDTVRERLAAWRLLPPPPVVDCWLAGRQSRDLAGMRQQGSAALKWLTEALEYATVNIEVKAAAKALLGKKKFTANLLLLKCFRRLRGHCRRAALRAGEEMRATYVTGDLKRHLGSFTLPHLAGFCAIQAPGQPCVRRFAGSTASPW